MAFLVQEMAPEGIECFVGGRQDPAFGPIIMVGLGGVFIEIFKDTALRMAPVTHREANDMLEELKAYPLLRGVRGKGPSDEGALIEVICRVASLLVACPRDLRDGPQSRYRSPCRSGLIDCGCPGFF